MNRKKICTKKKVTGVATLVVALAIVLTGTFAWKDFSKSALSLFSADAVNKHWVSLVDDFTLATSTGTNTNTLTGWKRGDVSDKKVYVTSDSTDTKANLTGYNADYATEYKPVYVRVKLTQTLTIGGGATITDPLANANSVNQYPTYVDWTQTGAIKTIDQWINVELQQQGAYWILDSDGWLYWAQPLVFGAKTAHLLDTVELIIEPEKDLEYTVDVTLQAVSSDLDSTTGTGEYLGGFKDWAIASTAKILPLFIKPFEFTIDTTKGVASTAYALQVNDDADNDFAVDWGDGTPLDKRTDTNKNDAHNYAASGVYTVKIIGAMPSAMSFYQDKKLTSVQSGFLQNTASTMFEYFRGCTNLKTISGNLFAKSTAVTNFGATFASCSSLTDIPVDLFKDNIAVTTFHSTFYYCGSLTSIPVGLFDNNPLVTTFGCTFQGCDSLTSIPVDLFKNNTRVTTFGLTFIDCTGITSIPKGLFDNNTAVLYINSTFKGCTNLTSIPAGLFDNNPLVEEFNSTFAGCTRIVSIPAELFGNNPAVTNFNGTFNGCSAITGDLPELWTSHLLATTYTNAFTGCTSASNIGAARTAGWAN